MIDDSDQSICVSEEGGPSNYSMIPKCIGTMAGLSNSAARLYLIYKGICGEDGVCWACDTTIAKVVSSLSVRTIIRARKELQSLGLIRIKREAKKSGGTLLRITITNIWEHNRRHKSAVLTKSPTPPPRRQVPNLHRGTKCQIGTEPSANLASSQVPNLHINNIPVKNITEKKITLSPGGDDVRAFPSSGGFIGEDRPQKKDYPAQAAKKLYGRLAAKLKITRTPSLAKWAAEFRRFLATGPVQKPRFHKVLKWYLMNIGEPFVPQAFSAEAFVQKFVRIEEAMGRMSRPIDERSMTVDQQIELVHKRVRSEPVEVFQRASWKDRLARISGEDNG